MLPNVPLLLETAAPAAISGAPQRPEPPRSFLDVLGAHLDRRYEEEKQRRIRDAQQARFQDSDAHPAQISETARSGNFAMHKLFLSMLLKLGGPAPVIDPLDPDAAALMHNALKARRCGARAPFAQDSDLFSMPRFPVTSVE